MHIVQFFVVVVYCVYIEQSTFSFSVGVSVINATTATTSTTTNTTSIKLLF